MDAQDLMIQAFLTFELMALGVYISLVMVQVYKSIICSVDHSIGHAHNYYNNYICLLKIVDQSSSIY